MRNGYYTRVIIKVEPIGKPRMTQSDKWRKRPAVQRYYDFKDTVQDFIGDTPLPERLVCEFYLTMPDSWGKKKRERMNGKPHQQKPDLDNLVKALTDSWSNEDKHLYSIRASKYWAESGYIKVELEGFEPS